MTGWYVLGIFVVSLGAMYVIVRVCSIAYYRTREEYDRKVIGRLINGDKNDAERP